ncbi:MAG TPA: sigma-54-dependent Fis family transcriptional regulator [Desulfuromonadales bacterium]|nr:sigma-54-dependent Fis family transcriptional regulator [Desulfuromonadales bacterium]
MKKILISWIGRTDLRAVTEVGIVGLGPIAQAVRDISFDRVVLLNNFPEVAVKPYLRWLNGIKSVVVSTNKAALTSPTNFAEIYEASVAAVQKCLIDYGSDSELTFHLSPGTPAMAAVWILIAAGRHPANLIESSREQGVNVVTIPFEIAAEYLPRLSEKHDQSMLERFAALPPNAPAFEEIIHQSDTMKRVVERARRVAPRNLPVLIEGESGTGKELLARAIHVGGLIPSGPFVAVNCGAIPENLMESEFFGHKKGSFTGAACDRKGHFLEADGGTLFLDEIGELPLAMQARLLRALQQGEVTPVGSSKSVPFKTRIIAATNRNLMDEVAVGRFREDLFYRLAVATLRLPALRERQGDVGLLIDKLLAQVSSELAVKLSLSPGARALLLAHSWPGNVRELLNTLHRVVAWCEDATISTTELREAILPARTLKSMPGDETAPLAESFSLPDVLADVARKNLEKAMKQAGGNKTKASKLLGLPNYQTLDNWLKKYGVE